MTKESSKKTTTSRRKKKKEEKSEESPKPKAEETIEANLEPERPSSLIQYENDPIQASLVNIMLDPNSDESTKNEARRVLDEISRFRNPTEYSVGMFYRGLTQLLIYIPLLVGLAMVISIFSPEVSDSLSGFFSFLSSVVWVTFLIFILAKTLKLIIHFDSEQKK